MSKEAMKLAQATLEAIATHCDLACVVTPDGAFYLQPAITALREARAEQPAQRKPLTDGRTKALWEQSRCAIPRYQMFKSLIEADHGIKETT